VRLAVRIALVQTNPTVGDIDGNTAALVCGLETAAAAGAELAVFPEQAVLGYPAKDLLMRREVIDRNVAAVERIASHTHHIAAIVGYAEPNTSDYGRPVFNTAALLAGGRVVARWRKQLLPTYDVFDEARYFEPGGQTEPCVFAGRRLGVVICEDMWSQEEFFSRPLYALDPVASLCESGADLLINISASPYTLGKHETRVRIMSAHVRRHGVPIVCVNQVGGNDELLFDGASCLVADGEVLAQAKAFTEDMLVVDVDRLHGLRREHLPAGPASLYEALVMGVRDYTRKCGFRTAVIGLSGGVDSALVAALAAAALGPENIHGVALPSRYSSAHSLHDAETLARALGIRYSRISIEDTHLAFERALADEFAGREPDFAEENIQARARAVILMALSNKFGSLLFTTGNKSELAVGYCTLYGDMCGALAVISDVPKTMVYAVAHYINARAGREVIPASTLSKPPSAELRPNQTDQQTLPPYEILDAILQRYEERLESVEQIVAAGFDRALVEDIVRRIHFSEYKRRQAAPGLKVTSRAFGFGRRMPIAARMPG